MFLFEKRVPAILKRLRLWLGACTERCTPRQLMPLFETRVVRRVVVRGAGRGAGRVAAVGHYAAAERQSNAII